MNAIAGKHKILLCFDNYEISRNYLDFWVIQLREYNPSLNIRLVIASRTAPGAKWGDLSNVTMHIQLDKFSKQEANQYLDAAGIKSKVRRGEIIKSSGCLPILMSWLASPNSEDPDPSLPTSDIVDRFLRWVENPELRIVALEASLPRFFNIDILTLLFSNRKSSEIELIFEWLGKQPFISHHELGWQYHDVVRSHMLRYQNQRSKNRSEAIHDELSNYYQKKLEDLGLRASEQWANKRAQELTFNYIYHSLLRAPDKNWYKFVNIFAYAIKYSLSFAKRMVEVLNQSSVLDYLEPQQREALELFCNELKIISSKARWSGIKLYDYLGDLDYLESDALAHILYLRGEAIRIKKHNYELALEYLNKAIELDPSYAQALAERGDLYIDQKKYREAVDEFDDALEIAPSYHWAYERKGYALLQLNRYEDALDALNKAEETNEHCANTLGFRGACFLGLEQYENALKDLNMALELEPEDGWSRIRRGEVYIATDVYELSLADFEWVIKKFPKHHGIRHEGLKNIGLVYSAQQKYEEAAEKFILSLEESPHCTHCWSALTSTYEKMYSRDEALRLIMDIKSPKIKFDVFTYLCRGASLLHMGHKEGIQDLKTAVQLKPDLVIPAWVRLDECGLQLAKAGQYEDAIYCYENSSEAVDYRLAYNLAVAWVLWKGADLATNQIEKAVQLLNELVNEDEETKGISLYGLAGLEAVKNNKSVALKLLREALLLSPNVILWVREGDPAWHLLNSDSEFQSVIS